MFSRRGLLLMATASLTVTGMGGSKALGFSSESMDPADLSALMLVCQRSGSHVPLLTNARRVLGEEITLGLKPATATEMVVCPLCRCSFQIIPDTSF